MSESSGAGSTGSSDAAEAFVPMRMGRLVLRDRSDQQWIQLVEVEGRRSFPIVIGPQEARELHRVLTGKETPRPLTHQLACRNHTSWAFADSYPALLSCDVPVYPPPPPLPPGAVCEYWCEGHPAPWATKCGYRACAECRAECAAI